LKKVIKENKNIDVNKYYINGKTIMSTLIDNIVNDEELFNMLFERGGYLEYFYISRSSYYSKLIERNPGLLKSIIHNGIICMDYYNNKIVKIDIPLIFFIKSGKENIVKSLLANGASVEETDNEGFTPIFHVIESGDRNLFNIILYEYHADITKKNKMGQTPLMYAKYLEKVRKRNLVYFIDSLSEMEKYNQGNLNILLSSLLKQKDYNSLKKVIMDNKDIDVNERYFNGKTIMSTLIYNKVDDEELFNMLFERGAYLNYIYILSYYSEYSLLVERNPGLLKSIIHNGIIYMNYYTKQIEKIDIPLIYLIEIERTYVVESLLENGASVEETDKEGFTPIFHVIKSGERSLFDIILYEYHADITKKNKMGQTPLMYAKYLEKEKKVNLVYFINSLSEMEKENLKTLLSSLLKQKDYNSLKKVIMDNKHIDVNKHYFNGKTIMSILIDNIVNDEELFNMLFERGAYLDYDYVSSNCNKYSSLIERNPGLLKSIIHNGIIYINHNNTEIKKIDIPLIYLIKSGKVKIVEGLLENGAPVEETDDEGFTPIFYSIECDRRNIFDLLLNKYHVNINKKNKMQQTPLMFARYFEKKKRINLYYYISSLRKIEKENIKTLLLNLLKQKDYNSLKKLLIDNKDINVNKYFNGKTIMSTLIDNIVNDEELFNMLFERGGYLDYDYISSNCNKYSSLIERNPGLLKSIIRNGIIYMNYYNERIKKNKIPLIYLIKSGKINIVKSLLENGASVEETDNEGFTPIFYAIKRGDRNLFDIILNKYHADITKKNRIGQTPLMYAKYLEKEKKVNLDYFINSLSEMEKENLKALLSSLLKQKDYNSLKKLLMDNKDIDVNKYFNGKTIISTLIDNIVDDEELFNMLFERGGYLDIKYFSEKKFYNLIIKNPGLIKSINRMGFMVRRKSDLVSIPIKQPIIFFIKCSKNELVQLLLKYGGSVNEVDNEGTTLILQSIKSNNIKIFKILLEKYHPDTSIKNKLGQTPLNYARNLKKNSNRGHEILRKEFISTLENYNEKMINLSSSTVKASSSTSSSTAKKTKLSVEEMIKEIKNLNSSNPTSSKTIPTTSTPLKTNLSMEKMVSENKNLNSNNPTSSTIIPIPINKELKKILEKQLIQDKPKNLDEVNDNKENIDYYLDNGVINNSNNEDEAALILNDEEWNENEEKIIDEIKNYDYFDEDNLN